MDELRAWDAVRTAAAIDAGEVTAAQAVAAAIDRAHACAGLAAVAAPLFAGARARATHGVGGRLGGVPTAVKEMFAIASAPLRHGSRALEGARAEHTDPAAQQHLDTGLVAIATTTMSEFGLTPTTEPLGSPPTHNPWRHGFSPGGSSGGSAALVAAGVVPIALGGDGGGSVRIPAAACGLVGLKPSRGRMAGLGELDRAPIALVVPGVLTRSVRDLAAYHAAAEAAHPSPAGLRPIGEVTGPSPQRLRIGVTTVAPNGAPVDQEVAAATVATADALADAGHAVRDVAYPHGQAFEEAFIAYFGALAAGTAVLGRRAVGRRFDAALLDPWTRGLAAHGRRTALRLPLALRELRRGVHANREVHAAVDVVLTPTTAHTAPPHGHLGPTVPFDVHLERLRRYMTFTPLHNVAGTPALSLPAGTSTAGLPIGVQLAALPGEERLLLELAHELEELRPWPRLAPRQAPGTGASSRRSRAASTP